MSLPNCVTPIPRSISRHPACARPLIFACQALLERLLSLQQPFGEFGLLQFLKEIAEKETIDSIARPLTSKINIDTRSVLFVCQATPASVKEITPTRFIRHFALLRDFIRMPR